MQGTSSIGNKLNHAIVVMTSLPFVENCLEDIGLESSRLNDSSTWRTKQGSSLQNIAK